MSDVRHGEAELNACEQEAATLRLRKHTKLLWTEARHRITRLEDQSKARRSILAHHVEQVFDVT